jgi:hypothetical protein
MRQQATLVPALLNGGALSKVSVPEGIGDWLPRRRRPTNLQEFVRLRCARGILIHCKDVIRVYRHDKAACLCRAFSFIVEC